MVGGTPPLHARTRVSAAATTSFLLLTNNRCDMLLAVCLPPSLRVVRLYKNPTHIIDQDAPACAATPVALTLLWMSVALAEAVRPEARGKASRCFSVHLQWWRPTRGGHHLRWRRQCWPEAHSKLSPAGLHKKQLACSSCRLSQRVRGATWHHAAHSIGVSNIPQTRWPATLLGLSSHRADSEAPPILAVLLLHTWRHLAAKQPHAAGQKNDVTTTAEPSACSQP